MQNNDTEDADVKGLKLLPSLKSPHLDQEDNSEKMSHSFWTCLKWKNKDNSPCY